MVSQSKVSSGIGRNGGKAFVALAIALGLTGSIMIAWGYSDMINVSQPQGVITTTLTQTASIFTTTITEPTTITYTTNNIVTSTVLVPVSTTVTTTASASTVTQTSTTTKTQTTTTTSPPQTSVFISTITTLTTIINSQTVTLSTVISSTLTLTSTATIQPATSFPEQAVIQGLPPYTPIRISVQQLGGSCNSSLGQCSYGAPQPTINPSVLTAQADSQGRYVFTVSGATSGTLYGFYLIDNGGSGPALVACCKAYARGASYTVNVQTADGTLSFGQVYTLPILDNNGNMIPNPTLDFGPIINPPACVWCDSAFSIPFVGTLEIPSITTLLKFVVGIGTLIGAVMVTRRG